MTDRVKTRHRGVYRRGACFVIYVDEKLKTLPEGTTLEEAILAREAAIGRKLDDLPKAIPAKPTKPRQGFVYVVHAADVGRCKIGWSQYPPAERVKELQVGSPVELVLVACRRGTIADERRLHKLFADKRVHSEWFDVSPDEILLPNPLA